MTRSKPQWNRLSSGLYVPPLLGFAGKPYPCVDCCEPCIACLDRNYPAEIDIEAAGFTDDACTKCANFNTTWTVPISVPCEEIGGGEHRVIYGDVFTPDIDYKPLFTPCTPLVSILWEIEIISNSTFTYRTIEVDLFLRATDVHQLWRLWTLFDGETGTPYDCANFASLDIPFDFPLAVFQSTCESSDLPTVALTANP